MDKFKIGCLKREIDHLTRILNDHDQSLKDIVRAQGAIKATITKLNYQPQGKERNLAEAERKLQILEQEYNTVNSQQIHITNQLVAKKMSCYKKKTSIIKGSIQETVSTLN